MSTPLKINDPVIPKGEIVVVTGANGYIGGHVADQFLAAGYKVRGTCRSKSRSAWVQELFDERYGNGQFEFYETPDMTQDGTYDEVVKGASGFVHVASVLNFSPNPSEVIPHVIKGTLEGLQSAAKEPKMKRFVLTSSSTAAQAPIPNKEYNIDETTWNDLFVEQANAPPPYEMDRAYAVYGASKVAGEKAMWDFVKEKKPHFVANSILPSANYGATIDGNKHDGSITWTWPRELFKGNTGAVMVPAQYFIDVRDCAALHVALTVVPGVENERVFGFAHKYTLQEMVDVLKKNFPNAKSVPHSVDNKDKELVNLKHEAWKRGEDLLKQMGWKGWKDLEESMVDNCKDMS